MSRNMRVQAALLTTVAAANPCTERQTVQLMTSMWHISSNLDNREVPSTAAFLMELNKRVSAIDSPCSACGVEYMDDLVAAIQGGCDHSSTDPLCVAGFHEIAAEMSVCVADEGSSAFGPAIATATAALVATLASDL